MLDAAKTHFAQTDSRITGLLDSATELALPAPASPDVYFKTLASSINSQQLSVLAAAAIWKRAQVGLGEVTPQTILQAGDDELRSFGLSRQKIRYLRSLAEHAASDVEFRNMHTLKDEEVIDYLTQITGIGRWTAEMFLMFALARPDVFSYGDLGLMRSLEHHYGIDYKDVEAAKKIIEPLSPHRTTAAMVLWYHKDGGPVLL